MNTIPLAHSITYCVKSCLEIPRRLRCGDFAAQSLVRSGNTLQAVSLHCFSQDIHALLMEIDLALISALDTIAPLLPSSVFFTMLSM